MKLGLNQSLGLAAILCAGAVQQASAHEQAGSLSATGGTAATGAGATDYYVVTCATDTATNTASDHLAFQIRDLSGDGNLVGMTVMKQSGTPANALAVTTVDPVGGTDVNYSQLRQIKGGNGDYHVTVWHTGAASLQNYTFTYHCQNADGTIHTATTILRWSNQ